MNLISYVSSTHGTVAVVFLCYICTAFVYGGCTPLSRPLAIVMSKALQLHKNL